MGIKNILIEYKIIYYPKFGCKSNHIKYFQSDGKTWTCRHWKYTLDRLKKNISKTVKQVKGSTILGYYKRCLKKIDLYQKKV